MYIMLDPRLSGLSIRYIVPPQPLLNMKEFV